MFKLFGFIIVMVIGLFGSMYFLQQKAKSTPNTDTSQVSTEKVVEMVDGKQIIQIKAKAGYFPMKVTAQAGVPTTLRVTTKGTFDCSAGVRIPSMNISESLPSTGMTDIDLGTPKSGKLAGTCSMGMYPFEIDFQG
ncbi:MAG: cupredoxin domain-containing protein [Candidatus Moranbacteria bacterium]|nr:cupredoxin domain-containing protein [Candidatus Moranbacteria bacterium]